MPVEINELTIRTTVNVPTRVVEVEAAKLEPDVDGQLESATVIDRLQMPDTFTLVFRDPDRDILDRAKLAIGKRVKISTAALKAEAPATLIDGEVTSIEVEYTMDGSRAVVRGYDLSHKLMAGGKSKTWDGDKSSDIAKKIADANNLKADVEPTREVHEHLVQANQSDLDFLMQLAAEAGFSCRVDGDTLIFKKADEGDRARLGRLAHRVPGPDRGRRPGQRRHGPRLGPQGEEGDHRQSQRDRQPRRPRDEARDALPVVRPEHVVRRRRAGHIPGRR
jgi:hypothetical protein